MADLTQSQIESWITEEAIGTFHYTKVLDGQIPPKLYNKLRAIMHKLKTKGVVCPVTSRGDGWWRAADNSLDELQWWESEAIKEDNLLLPLTINNYCIIPRPSLVIISGKYNAGKSAFCLNTVMLNTPKWGGYLDFYVSEGAELIKPKFAKLGITEAPSFRTYRRTENFADIINPDNLSVIDYLRVNMEQSYAVTEKLFEIFNKLKTGIAVVAMQKPPGERKVAFGGASTAFEPTLYVGMDKDYLGFEKIKVPKLTDIDPYALKIQFKIANGVNFYDVHEVVE